VIYISHATKDLATAVWLHDTLIANGHDVFMYACEGEKSGRWTKHNIDKVHESARFLLLLSEHAARSQNVLEELQAIWIRARFDVDIVVLCSLIQREAVNRIFGPHGPLVEYPGLHSVHGEYLDFTEEAREGTMVTLLELLEGFKNAQGNRPEVCGQQVPPRSTIPAGEGEQRLIMGTLDPYAGVAELCRIEVAGSQLLVRCADMKVAHTAKLGFEPEGLWLATDGRTAAVTAADRIAILSLGDDLTPRVIAIKVDGWDPSMRVLGVARYGDLLRLIGSSESTTREVRVSFGFKRGDPAAVYCVGAIGEGSSVAALPLPGGFLRTGTTGSLSWVSWDAGNHVEENVSKPPLDVEAECIGMDAATHDGVVLLAALFSGPVRTDMHVVRCESGEWEQVTFPVGDEGDAVQVIRVAGDGGAPGTVALRSHGQFSLWDWDDLKRAAVDEGAIGTSTVGPR